MIIKTNKVIFLLLSLVAVFGQEEQQHQEPPPACSCDEVVQARDKCFNDWQVLDQLRATLQQQVKDVEWNVNERCKGEVEQTRGEVLAQLEQARGEGQAQVEEARNEGRAQLELVRSESMRNLEAVQNESNAKVEETQRIAKEELSQCQTQHHELNAQFEQQGNTHRQLQESTRQLEETLSSIKSEKQNLEKSLSEKDLSLTKEKKSKEQIERDLEAIKKTLDEMIAAKSIIMIDYDLLNERIEEIKAQAKVYFNDFMAIVGEHTKFARDKAKEFYTYVETEIYPQVKQTVEKDVIPVVQSSWKQACDMWEEIYSPYRPEVNKQIKVAKKEIKTFYKGNVEPTVKEYELDVHAANAKKTVEEYATLAHNNLVNGLKTSSGVALNFVKLEEGPDFVIDALENVHANHEDIVYYIECLVAFIVVYHILKMTIFRKKKKPKKPKLTKQQIAEKERKAVAAQKSKQQHGSAKGKAQNGKKNSKKNK